MGVRLVMFDKAFAAVNGTNVPDPADHNLLINRDMKNQHPIQSITGLHEILQQLLIAMHTHDNKTVIDLFDRIGDVLYWNGKPILEIQISNDAGNSITRHNDGLYVFSEYAHYINTKEIYFTKTAIDSNNYNLQANLKLLNHEDNAIQIHPGGVFVNKYSYVETEDTLTGHLYQVGEGETLQTMFAGGHVFAHQGTWSNIANATEANAWYFDASLDSFVQPLNTNSFTGFVSSIKYKTYVHRVRLRSVCSWDDDDINGLIIGYTTDNNGHPHTLSVIIAKGNNGNTPAYQIWYDFCLPDQQLIKSGPVLNAYSFAGWASVPNGIVVEVHKTGNLIETQISDWNGTTLNATSALSIDLNDYSWGYLFKGWIQYGYCNQSQELSFFTDIYFDGIGPLKCDVILSPDEGNSLEIRKNGLYCKNNGNANSGISIKDLDIQDIGYGYLMLDNGQINHWEVYTGDCIEKFTTRSTNLEDNNGNIILKKGHKYLCNASLLGDYNSSAFYTVPECKITNNIGHKTALYQSETSALIEPQDDDVVLHLYIESYNQGTQFAAVSWISIHELAQSITINTNTGGGDCPIGQIMSYMGNYPPEHYLECNGDEYNIADYPILAEHFLTQYGTYNFFGGNGIDTFCVPDLKDYDPQTFNSLKYFHCQDNKQLHEADDKLFLVQAEDVIEASIMYCIKYEMSVSQSNGQNITENIDIQQEIIDTLAILNA